MKIYLGSDHAGFKLKERIKKYFDKKGIKYDDLGNTKLDKKDDYPDFGNKVAKAVAKNKNSTGILMCGSSSGVCIVANKTRGIRAVSISNVKNAKLARAHNDGNVICLSGWDTSFSMAKKVISAWLETPAPTEARHKRRINKIKIIEKNV